MLTNADIRELTSFRRELHRTPELSGEEAETAKDDLRRPDRTRAG